MAKKLQSVFIPNLPSFNKFFEEGMDVTDPLNEYNPKTKIVESVSIDDKNKISVKFTDKSEIVAHLLSCIAQYVEEEEKEEEKEEGQLKGQEPISQPEASVK